MENNGQFLSYLKDNNTENYFLVDRFASNIDDLEAQLKIGHSTNLKERLGNLLLKKNFKNFAIRCTTALRLDTIAVATALAITAHNKTRNITIFSDSQYVAERKTSKSYIE
uniref:RNase H domain-containing protein n=1 Tax=Strongyloides stercoralis TaxID=6248 RepID=A0A0K0EGW7_STRER